MYIYDNRLTRFVRVGCVLSGISGIFIGVANGYNVRGAVEATLIGSCFTLAAAGVEYITRSPKGTDAGKRELAM